MKTDRDGRTELHIALVPIGSDVDYSYIQSLVASGCDLNAQDNGGFTALHFAAQEGLVRAVKILLAGHADPNLKDSWGNSPLARVHKSEAGIEIVKLLLQSGADAFLENNSSISPAKLMAVVTADDPEVSEFIQTCNEIYSKLKK